MGNQGHSRAIKRPSRAFEGTQGQSRTSKSIQGLQGQGDCCHHVSAGSSGLFPASGGSTGSHLMSWISCLKIATKCATRRLDLALVQQPQALDHFQLSLADSSVKHARATVADSSVKHARATVVAMAAPTPAPPCTVAHTNKESSSASGNASSGRDCER